MKLSIIITTRNRKEDLILCINSIKLSKNITFDWELVIIDDNSNDWTENVSLEDFWINSGKVIHNSVQYMMVWARNLGVENSKWDYILFIDDDNVIEENMISELVQLADNNLEYGIIWPSMYFLNTKEKYMDYQKINLFTWKTTGFVDLSSEYFFDSDWVPNVFLIKREVFNNCWVFDKNLIQTFTEPDFAFNARRYWYKCWMFKNAITYHNVFTQDTFSPRALWWKFNQKAYCLIRNRMIFISRYGKIHHKLIYIIFFSWFWPIVYSILVLRFKRFDLVILYWKGFIDWIYYFLTWRINNSILAKLAD